MSAYGESGVRIEALPAGVWLRAEVAPPGPRAHAPEQAARIDALWERLCRDNDRLYDGPILRTVSVDVESGVLLCRRDTFRSLAASAQLGLGVRQLGVMGVVTGRDRAARERVLLARRSAQTRIYPGLWELAPSGGVSPPAPSVGALGPGDLAAALADEADEELGLSFAGAAVRPLAILRDDAACSDDVALRVELPGVIDPRRGACAGEREALDRWEYLDAAWVALDEVGAFAREHGAAIAPPTLAMLRWLGWA